MIYRCYSEKELTKLLHEAVISGIEIPEILYSRSEGCIKTPKPNDFIASKMKEETSNLEINDWEVWHMEAQFLVRTMEAMCNLKYSSVKVVIDECGSYGMDTLFRVTATMTVSEFNDIVSNANNKEDIVPFIPGKMLKGYILDFSFGSVYAREVNLPVRIALEDERVEPFAHFRRMFRDITEA